jgi:hypothetical protein
MKRLLQSKRPTGSSELDFFLQEVWDAIQVFGRIVDQPGKLTVEYTNGGIVLTPQSPGATAASSPHPFKIVRGSTWLKYIIKTGHVITATTETPVIPTDVETEITVTAGAAQYWFYVNIAGATPAIEHSASIPTWTEALVPIGYVITTNEEDEESEIGLQFLRENIYSPCV